MEARTEISPPRTDPRRVREVARATAGGAIVLVAVVGLYLTVAPYDASTGTAPARAVRLLPSALGPLDRAWVVTGEEALRQVRGLHMGTFRMSSAEVAGYGQDTTVWVATPARPGAVDAFVTRMADAISTADTPFAPPVETPSDSGIWWTDGTGQQHVFFAADGAIWWLAAHADDADDALSALLREVRS